MPNSHHQYLSTAEVAKLLGISVVAVFKRIKSGRLKAQKIGRSYAIHRKEVADLLPDFDGSQGLGDDSVSLMEAAHILGVTRMTIYNWIRSGKLSAKKVGRHFVIARAELSLANEEPSEKLALEKDYVSVMEYADIVGSNRKTVLNHINQGHIKARKVGRHYVIAREDIPLAGLFVSPAQHRPEEYVSIAEAAKRLGMSRIAVFKKVKKGQLPAQKMGRSYAILATAIEAKDDK